MTRKSKLPISEQAERAEARDFRRRTKPSKCQAFSVPPCQDNAKTGSDFCDRHEKAGYEKRSIHNIDFGGEKAQARAAKLLKAFGSGKIEVVKCGCGHPSCSKNGLNVGMFYQGSGFDIDQAQLICDLINEGRGIK